MYIFGHVRPWEPWFHRQGSEPIEATPATSIMTKIQSSDTKVTSSGIHLKRKECPSDGSGKCWK